MSKQTKRRKRQQPPTKNKKSLQHKNRQSIAIYYPQCISDRPFPLRYLLHITRWLSEEFGRDYSPISARVLEQILGRQDAKWALQTAQDENLIERVADYSNQNGTKYSGHPRLYRLLPMAKNDKWIVRTFHQTEPAVSRIIKHNTNKMADNRKKFYRTSQMTILKDMPHFGFSELRLEKRGDDVFLVGPYGDVCFGGETEQEERELRERAIIYYEKINNGQWFNSKPSAKSNRLYTNFTNLTKKLLPYLTAENLSLIQIDCKNSQPLFFAGFLLDEYNKTHNTNTKHKHNNYYVWRTIQKHNLNPYIATTYEISQSVINRKDKGLHWDIQNEITTLTDIVSSGTFYEFLIWLDNPDFTIPKELRAKTKTRFYSYAYGQNYITCCRTNPVARVFQDYFPAIHSIVVQHKKEHGYQSLACAMQRAESEFHFRYVVPYIRRQVKAKLQTRHDSILIPTIYNEIGTDAYRYAFSEFGMRGAVSITDISPDNPDLTEKEILLLDERGRKHERV